LASVADTAIIPLQDVLGLGTEARMNLPASTSGNWAWRYKASVLTDKLSARLRDMTELYGRVGRAETSDKKSEANLTTTLSK
ncbi:MAG: 4-alpha-glucanotransferase, partial [Acidobacteriota bacterium]|nr:4-alpha-glucanotransferase [Acidobacteriota bacterium]